MYNNFKILAIIPARGGSKGIPRKNVRFLFGKPLISYIINTALDSQLIDEVVVTSDDDEIIEISRFVGIKNIVKRSKDLADDNTPLDPVIIHAVNIFEKTSKKSFDIIITLQPTSPLLKKSTLDSAIKYFIEHKCTTLISITEFKHLFWIKKKGKFELFHKKRLNRQYLKPIYLETGGFVICKKENLSKKTRLVEPIDLYKIDHLESIDIDTNLDWIVAATILGKKKIIIRVDGDHTIGLGHVYRTLTIANELLGHNVIFVSKKQSKLGISKINSFNYPLIEIVNDDDFFEIIERENPDIIFLDILDTDEKYFRKFPKDIFIVSFEDMGAGLLYADIVFNALYNEQKIKRDCIYTGYNYVCLRDEFHLVPFKTVKKEVKTILITFGGVDQNNLTYTTLRVVEKLKMKNVDIVIVTGLGYRYIDELSKYVDELNNNGFKIRIYNDVKFMAKLIYNSDIAITSNGRTIFEIASIGVPCISIAQNQRETLHTFAQETDGIIYLGLVTKGIESKIEKSLIKLIHDYKERVYMNNILRNLNLRKGTKNIVNIIFDKYWQKKNY